MRIIDQLMQKAAFAQQALRAVGTAAKKGVGALTGTAAQAASGAAKAVTGTATQAASGVAKAVKPGAGAAAMKGLNMTGQAKVHGALNVLQKVRAGQQLTVAEQGILTQLKKMPQIAKRFGLPVQQPQTGGAMQALISPAEDAALRGSIMVGG